MSSLIGTTINQQYLLTDILGEGGMGIVFKAENLNLNNRLCAIKLLKGHTTDPNEVRRFESELQIISKLRSPHVVQVLNKGYFEGHRLYIVMELLEGEPLSTLLKREKSIKIKRAVQITKGVLAGLSEAHDYGVVHRDLKPANIFITRSRARDEITKVLDFGIAKDTNKDDTTGLTSASMIIGTPKYMAPEQFMKQDTDQRTDLYAVGLLLYQMLSGAPPYLPKSDLVPQTLKSMPDEFKVGWLHLNADPKPLKIPTPLWDLCARMLHKDPTHRPDSAAEVISELSYIIEQMDTGSGPFSTHDSMNANGISALKQTLPLGSGVTPHYEVNVPPSGPHQVVRSSSGPHRVAHPTSGPHQLGNVQGSGPYPSHQHHSAPYPSRPLNFDEESALSSRQALKTSGQSSLAQYDQGVAKSNKGKVLAGVLAGIAIATYGAVGTKNGGGNTGLCFERIKVDPPGIYMVSKSVLNAQTRPGKWTIVGDTGLDGQLPTILARPCQQRWRVEVKRKGYKPAKLTLSHIDKSQVQIHRIKALPQEGSSKVPVDDSASTSTKSKNNGSKKSKRDVHTKSKKRQRKSAKSNRRRSSWKSRKSKSTTKSTAKSTQVKQPKVTSTATSKKKSEPKPIQTQTPPKPTSPKAPVRKPAPTSTIDSGKEKLIF